ncbi:PASTA domain-containing protein [Nonomuraea sp. NPDC049141]|uniref:PASTA domain-containing protein n=1 Tax=Nonomuraea sp. NPDC049141 TaxID=3155500 RepID=UPI0034046572
MRFEVAKALAVSMIALAAGPAMASSPAPPAPPDTQTDEPTKTPTDTDTITPTGPDTPAPQKCAPLGDPDPGYGPRSGPVPGVVGRTKNQAKAELKQGGFAMEARPSGAADDWIVRRQIPRGDAPCGSTVVILLVEYVEVPDVVGDRLGRAEHEIQGRGLFSAVAEGEAADPPVVASQDPKPGRRVPKGSTVTLHLSPATPTRPTVGPDPSKSDASSSTEPPGWLVPAAAAVAGAAAAWAVRRVLRGPRPAPASVVCVPCVDPSPGVEVRDPAPTAGVTFVCHHDQGRQEIREIVR